MKKPLIILLILCLATSVFGQFQQKPMLGVQIDKSHPLGDPVAAWFFNEGSGNKVFDLSGNGLHGTGDGNGVWTSGKFGSAILLDGSTGNYDTPADFTSKYDYITVIAWVFCTSVAGTDYVVDHSSGASGFGLRREGTLWSWFCYSSAGHVPTTWDAAATGSWHQLVGTHGANNKLYVDGILRDSAVSAVGITASADTMRLGSDFAGVNEWAGYIDHIIIYSREFTAEDVALLSQEPFCMFAEDNIALMAVEAPAPGGGQVIYIQTGMVSILFALVLMRRKFN